MATHEDRRFVLDLIDKFNHTQDDTRYFALAKLGEDKGMFIGTTTNDVAPREGG